MDISVIICTYNRGNLLHSVLLDLTRQDAVSNISFEVIIVDNNSTDNTKQVCDEFVARCPITFRYIFEERQGKIFALNTGIKESKGRIIAFTDDDIILDSKWLLSIKQAFSVNPDCKAFGGRVLPLWPDTLPVWIAKEGTFRNTDGVIVEHDLGDIDKSYHQPGMYPAIGANMFFAREVFDKYGGFNERMNLKNNKKAMVEDTELCNRLLRNKEQMIYRPDSIVYHPVCDDRLTKSYFRKYSFRAGRLHNVMNDHQTRGQYVILNLRKNNRILCNVPLYLFRDIATKFFQYIVATCKKRPQEIILLEKSIIFNAGIVYELLKERWEQTPS